MNNENAPYKPTIALDFDGVIHAYKGWNGGNLSGAVDGANSAVQRFLDLGNKVVIFSTRDTDAIAEWLYEYGFPDDVEISSKNPPFRCLIDDRAILFTGQWTPELIDKAHNFTAYWEKGKHVI